MDDKTKTAIRRNFDAIANEPATWVFTASGLDQAAHLLEPHFSTDLPNETDHSRIVMSAFIRGPILMLRGCALECLLKALYVANGNKLGRAGSYLPPGGKDHDLVTLADKATFPLSPAEKSLVTYLGRFIIQGRYPILRRAPEAWVVLADGSRRHAVWTPQDERDYHAFRSRLRAEVERLAKRA